MSLCLTKEDKMFDYYTDVFGSQCLQLAQKSKADVGFGAVLVCTIGYNKLVIGQGWNRRSIAQEREMLSHVDYAIHAEQAAVVDAWLNHNRVVVGFDPKKHWPSFLVGCDLYVLGIVHRGQNKGTLTTRTENIFVCKKCIHTIKRFNLTVHIPLVDGWGTLTADEAFETGMEYAKDGYWSKFINGEKVKGNHV